MKYRRLGKTNLQVSQIGLGGLFIAAEGIDTGIATIHRALELGINYFDTAPGYWSDMSEETLGRGLEGVKTPHYVSTKLRPHPEERPCAYSYDQCMRWFERSLKRLRRDHIDILYIHDPDRLGDGSYATIFGKGRAMDACQKLKEQGAIKAIALGSLWLDYQAYCIETGMLDVILTFNRYDMVWRDAEMYVFPHAKRKDVGVVLGGPLHQGVLSLRRDEWFANPPDWMTPNEHVAIMKLYHIQEQAGIPLAEMGLRWTLANEMVVPIPGAANIEQLELNVAAAEKGPLPEDIKLQLDAIGILHEDPRRER